MKHAFRVYSAPAREVSQADAVRGAVPLHDGVADKQPRDICGVERNRRPQPAQGPQNLNVEPVHPQGGAVHEEKIIRCDDDASRGCPWLHSFNVQIT